MPSDDDKVQFGSSDPFASAAPAPDPVEPVPVPDSPSPEPELEPEETPEPSTAPADAEPAPVVAPEGDTPAPDVAPTDELPPLPEMTVRERAMEEETLRLQMALDTERAQNTLRAQQEDIVKSQRRQNEDAHIGWAKRVLADKDFETAEIDRLGITQYANAISWANILIDRHEREAQDQALKAQIQSQEEIRAEVENRFKRNAAGQWAIAYGKSRGLTEEQITKVFAEHGHWSKEPDIDKARLNARNALFFAAQNQGVPATARTLVTAEQDARRIMASAPAKGGAPRQRVEDPNGEWANNMAAAINGPGGTIFK